MRIIRVIFFFTTISGLLSAQPVISLQQYVTGLSQPVDVVHCGDDRLFIVQQNGIIRIIDGQGNLKPKPFLDIDSRVNTNGEQGLLGMAFHPDYKNNGYFFVNYIYDDPVPGNSDNNTRISRFKVSATNPDSAIVSSEEIVMTINQPYTNHNGGDLAFGPDGYLYIPTGDGGDGGDPQNHAQNRKDFLGKILRLDVDSLPYKIPLDNPFMNDSNTYNEIWAIGMRNPWRFSFDRLSGDLWLGDVGQGTREEINFQPASSPGGENYGWRCYEGNATHNTSGCSTIGNYTFPVFDFDNNSLGCSVVGGNVYRGCKYPSLFGYYVFCDYCSGRFWTIRDSSGVWVTKMEFDSNNFRYSAIGEDQNGELYVAGLGNGIIYKLIEATPVVCTATIFGTIVTEQGGSIGGVEVTLSGDTNLAVVTGSNGFYNFTVPQGGDYIIAPSKNNDVFKTNGITTIDLALTQRHVLAIDTLDSPYKIIAADVNVTGSLSTVDIGLTQNMVLGIDTVFQGGRLWTFVKSDFIFNDPVNPFSYDSSRTYSNLISDIINQNFIGIKLGDVNGSWNPTIP